MNTVESLKQLYVKMGGNLTDSYPEIASGISVSDYVLIPDCISALNEVAGGGSGANVLTLYAGQKGRESWVYKNPERTEEYASYEEAKNAVKNADVITILMPDGGEYSKIYPTAIGQGSIPEGSWVCAVCVTSDATVVCYLWSDLPSSGGGGGENDG
jgi:hypothetical protein